MKSFLTLFILFFAVPAFAGNTFGRYIGVLKHREINQDQLARIDFVTEQESGGVLNLRATLVLYYGDFDSDEYASYDYDRVTYNLLTGTLVFDSSERELHFVVNNFRPGSLSAELKTGAGIVGDLQLTQDTSVTPERPLIQPLWGEYRGVCQGVGQRLQIQSSPSHPIATNRTDPFAPFVIRAQRGDNGGGACPLGVSTCITDVFDDADYDYFKGHIDFHGQNGALSCEVDEFGLTCGDCRLTRSSKEHVSIGTKTLPGSSPKWTVALNETSTAAGIQGLYKGFVHLEARDLYQPFTVAVTTYRQNSNGSGSGDALMVSVVASLKYGGHTDTDESINTKFDPRPFNIMNAQPIFDRADHTTDMLIKITKIGGGMLEGEWFSRRFGHVGTFSLASSGIVQLSEPEKIDSRIAGNFTDGLWNINMRVALSDRATSSKDPFSPLTIQGFAWITNITSRLHFTDAAFDPFTGKFSLDFGESGSFIGKRTTTGVFVKRPNVGIIRPMQPHALIKLMEISP